MINSNAGKWETKAVTENPNYPSEREKSKAMDGIKEEVTKYLNSDHNTPFRGFTVNVKSITPRYWRENVRVSMTVAKDGDIEYFYIMLPVEVGALPPESNKEKLDELIKENQQHYTEKIEEVEGIDKAEYNETTNQITVYVDVETDTDVETAFQNWKNDNKDNIESEKKDLVDQLTEVFGEDWVNVDSVHIAVKVSQGIKEDGDDKDIVKKPGETIEAFVDRYYADRDNLEQRVLDKLHKKLEEEGKEKLLFEHLPGMNVTEKITVNYSDGRDSEVLDGYKLYMTQSQS